MRRPRRLPRLAGGGALTARAYPDRRLRAKPLRPSQPQLTVLKATAPRWTEIERQEVRYLFDDIEELLAETNKRTDPKGYRTNTVYLGRGRKGQRRLRRYDSKGPWYLEVKKRKGDVVRKRRRIFYGKVPTGKLSSNYWRIAYEWGPWRLTIDRNVRFSYRGSSIKYTGYVVELKGRSTFVKAAAPPWLAKLLSGKEAPGFGKRKWAMMTLDI